MQSIQSLQIAITFNKLYNFRNALKAERKSFKIIPKNKEYFQCEFHSLQTLQKQR